MTIRFNFAKWRKWKNICITTHKWLYFVYFRPHFHITKLFNGHS